MRPPRAPVRLVRVDGAVLDEAASLRPSTFLSTITTEALRLWVARERQRANLIANAEALTPQS